MALGYGLNREEQDRQKFTGYGGVTTDNRDTSSFGFMPSLRKFDQKLGQGINYLGENLPKVPGLALNATKKAWENSAVAKPADGSSSPAQAARTGLGIIKSHLPGYDPPEGLFSEETHSRARSALSRNPPQIGILSSHSPTSLKPQPSALQPSAPSSTVKDGWTSTPNPNVYGGKVLTYGTPGTDNSGWGFVSGPARQQMARPGNPGIVAGANGPYTVTGDPDAVARFSRPVAPAVGWDGNTQSSEPAAYKQVRGEYSPQRHHMEMPTYQGPESGIGHQARLEIYKQQMEAYNRAMGNNTQLDMEQMREAGAGYRSMQQAKEANDRSTIARQQLGLDQQKFDASVPLNQAQLENQQMQIGFSKEEAAARKQLSGLRPGTPEYAEAERRYATLLGKFGEQKPPNVQKLTSEDVQGNKTQALYRVNNDGTFTRMQESGQQFEEAPTDIKKRVQGRVYRTPNGLLLWNGKNWGDLAVNSEPSQANLMP